MRFTHPLLLMCALAALSACASPVPSTRGSGESASVTQTQEPRTLRIVLRNEPFDLTDSASGRNNVTLVLFGGRLAHTDDQDIPFPVLSESLPQLNTDTWRILGDGQMETTYRLRPNLTWHDGTPLTADDFVFSHRADQVSLEVGVRESAISPVVHRAIREVLAPDPRTVVIRWKQLFQDAAAPDLKVFPRHILEAVVDQGQAEGLGSHPYWTTGFMNAGPFKVAKWEQGAFLEGVAFDGFALGRPKLDRILITWNGDPNATLARVLAGDTDLALDGAIFYPQAATLKKEWVPRGDGAVILKAGSLRFVSAQHRTIFATPASVLDRTVRRATAHAIDRQALSDALVDGYGPVGDLVAPPGVRYYAELERAAPKYPLDLRRTEQLMGEAGFSKGPDGFYASSAEARHAPDLMGVAEGQEAQETTIIADFLKRAGIDAQLRLVPQAQLQQADELKSNYPAWRTNYGLGSAKNLSADRLLGSRSAGPENRWGGTNKMGWSHPEHDRLYDQWTRALDPTEADRILVQIGKIQMEEVPFIPTYFDPTVAAHAASLMGPTLGFGTAWSNVHQWAWK